MGRMIYKGEEYEPVGNYASCLQNKYILHDSIRENPIELLVFGDRT